MFDYINKQKYTVRTATQIFEIQYVFKNVQIAAEHGFNVCTDSFVYGEVPYELQVYMQAVDSHYSRFAVVDKQSKYAVKRIMPIKWAAVPDGADNDGYINKCKFVSEDDLIKRYNFVGANGYNLWFYVIFGGLGYTDARNATYLCSTGLKVNKIVFELDARFRILKSTGKTFTVNVFNTYSACNFTINVDDFHVILDVWSGRVLPEGLDKDGYDWKKLQNMKYTREGDLVYGR